MCYKDKAERKWRRTKSHQDFCAFKGAQNRATFVMNGARCECYTNLIAENSSNQRNLFRTTKSLLCEPSEVSFPKDIAPDDLAKDFGNFFMQKIDKINQLIDMQSSAEMSKAGEKGCADSDTYAGVTFANFKRYLKSKSLSSSRKLPRNRVRWIQRLLR